MTKRELIDALASVQDDCEIKVGYEVSEMISELTWDSHTEVGDVNSVGVDGSCVVISVDTYFPADKRLYPCQESSASNC